MNADEFLGWVCCLLAWWGCNLASIKIGWGDLGGFGGWGGFFSLSMVIGLCNLA